MELTTTDKLFDINKLPAQEWIIVFPISMSKISNIQSAKNCWEYIKIFSPDKITKPLVWLNFIYWDFLYFNSDEKASTLKNKFQPLTLSHKNEFQKIISKNPFYIQKAFSFWVWNQIILECKDFINLLSQLRKHYENNEKFKKCIEEDLVNSNRTKLDENQLNFFLEETLLFYLIIKWKVNLRNDYIENQEKWILWCYPWEPLKSQIYLIQNNIFWYTNKKNKYENCYYNLLNIKLYDLSKISLNLN